MSRTAQNLIELLRLAQGGAGALTQHLLRELAAQLIAPRMVGHGRLTQSRQWRERYPLPLNNAP